MLRSDDENPAEISMTSSADGPVELTTSVDDAVVGGDLAAPTVVEYIGRLRVTVVGHTEDPNRLAVVAMHDIGTNAFTCFGDFLAYCNEQQISSLVGSVVYYIDAPGHEENAPTLPAQDPWYTLEDLAEEMHKVVARFGLSKFLGLGVGAGARVLLSYTMSYPAEVRGLILVTPVIRSSGIIERISISTSVRYVSFAGWNQQLKDRLLSRWLSPHILQDPGNPIASKHIGALDRLNPFNIARYLSAYASRRSIESKLPSIHKRTLIITGSASPLVEEAEAVLSSSDPSMTTLMELRGGGSLCLDEDKRKCAEAIKLFLQSFGAM